MPVGEHAYECGFVVLHEAATCTLFGEKNASKITMSTHTGTKYEGRVTAFAIPRQSLWGIGVFKPAPSLLS